jgi:hypothetical protein
MPLYWKYMFIVCRSIRAVVLSENTGRNRISGSTNAFCNRSAEWFNGKYFQLLGKNNPPYRNNHRSWNSGFHVYPEKIQKNGELIGRAKLLMSIMLAYVLGAVFSGLTYYYLEFRVFYVISVCLLIVIGYDAYKIHVRHFNTKYRYNRIYKKPNLLAYLYEKIHGIPKRKEKKTCL